MSSFDAPTKGMADELSPEEILRIVEIAERAVEQSRKLRLEFALLLEQYAQPVKAPKI